MNKEEIENINKKLNTTEDDQMTINLLYQKVEILESILDKVTDKLKEDKNKKIPLAEDMDWVICRKQYAREILNIIEGEKNERIF